jgi:hypothetical protein
MAQPIVGTNTALEKDYLRLTIAPDPTLVCRTRKQRLSTRKQCMSTRKQRTSTRK